jgi:hypothetical protein
MPHDLAETASAKAGAADPGAYFGLSVGAADAPTIPMKIAAHRDDRRMTTRFPAPWRSTCWASWRSWQAQRPSSGQRQPSGIGDP